MGKYETITGKVLSKVDITQFYSERNRPMPDATSEAAPPRPKFVLLPTAYVDAVVSDISALMAEMAIFNKQYENGGEGLLLTELSRHSITTSIGMLKSAMDIAMSPTVGQMITRNLREAITDAKLPAETVPAAETPAVTWYRQTGGLDQLDAGQREQAQAAYDAWVATKPTAAAKHDLAAYVGYRQDRYAAAAAKVSKAGPVTATVAPAAAPAAWLDKTGGLEKLSPHDRAEAQTAYDEWAKAKPEAGAKHDLAAYVSYRQERKAYKAAPKPAATVTL